LTTFATSTPLTALPLPSHTVPWQSAGTSGEITVPLATFRDPHTPAVQVAATHGFVDAGHSAAIAQPPIPPPPDELDELDDVVLLLDVVPGPLSVPFAQLAAASTAPPSTHGQRPPSFIASSSSGLAAWATRSIRNRRA
jgi:hypothetical protein